MHRILFFLIFSIFIIPYSSHGLFPIGRERMSSDDRESTWDSNGFGISYKYQYSLKWDEETCRTRALHDIGYVKTYSMNPGNPDGFFNPGITTSHGMSFYDFWNGTTCRSFTSDTFTAVPPDLNKAFCRSLGVFSAERVCFAAKRAPSSKKELYRWLAEIDYDFSGRESQNNENLKKVRDGDDAALNAGYKTFRDIKMSWIRDIGLDSNEDVLKKYIAPFRGQKMVCARTRGFTLVTSNTNLACSDPEKCLSMDALDLIIKCLPVPMGPPPHPMTPFIIGKEAIYSVPVRGMQYSRPEARIVYFEKKVKKVETKNNLSEGSNILNGSRYKFRIDVGDDSICSFVTHVGNKEISSPYPIGCQNRGLAPNPDIVSKNPLSVSGKEARKLSGQISYPWVTLATLRPTSLDELKDFKRLEVNKEIYINKKYGNITIFQGAFNRNPERRKFDLRYLEKKMCFVNASPSPIIEYVSTDYDCYSLPSMVKRKNIDVYRCTNESKMEIFVPNISDCAKFELSHDGKPSVKGNQCHDDSFSGPSKKCQDITSSITYEHDDEGKKLCIRNWNFGEKRYVVLRRNPLNTSEVEKIKIVEANNVLMPLDAEGNVDFTKNPQSLENFSQDDLDYFRRLDESHYWYKNVDGGIDVRYRYGPKIFQVGDQTTTYLNAETGQPVFLRQDDELIEADPMDRGLCSDAIIPYLSPRTWSYILQMPGYYTNYNDAQFNDDTELKAIESRLIKTPGMLTINGSSVQDLSKFDDIKKATLLIPTKFENRAQVSDAILGIASDSVNRNIKIDSLHQSIKDTFNTQSFNFYSDYFVSRKQNKILYSNSKDLRKDKNSNALSDKLFDTSTCNLIEFEIWGGGGESRSIPSTFFSGQFAGTYKVSFTNSVTDVLQNNASSGQNGAYVRGRFAIREKSLLKMKVSDASGKISDGPNTISDSMILSDDYSSISVTDKIDKDLQVIRVSSGSGKHECQTNPNCASLKEEIILEKAINDDLQLIVKDDDSRESFKRNNNIKSLEKKSSFIDSNLIAIDAYRNVTMSSFSGRADDLFSSLPLSSPIVINKYIRDDEERNYGYKIEKFLLPLTKVKNSSDWKDDGSGNFNEIGTYYYLGQLLNIINWGNRARYTNSRICISRLDSCYRSSKIINDDAPKFIYGGNAGGSLNTTFSNFLTDFVLSSTSIDKTTLVTDLNLYCPGLGGCYINAGVTGSNRFISQSGTAGLIKIKCLKI